jgi:ribosomal protein L3
VVDLDPEKNLILLRGAVPGHAQSLVFISPTIKPQKASQAATS